MEQSVLEVRRFNQGFYNFGPLEQCDTGRLMLSEEVIPVVQSIWDLLGRYDETNRELSNRCGSLEEALEGYRALNKDLKKENDGLTSANDWYLSKIVYLERRLTQAGAVAIGMALAAISAVLFIH